MTVRTTNWHSKVYHPKVSDCASRDWKAISDFIKKRDKRACKACGLRFNLTVHHIIPRKEGGSNDPTNLITLCTSCHDTVEIEGLKTKLEIIGCGKRKYIRRDPRITEPDIKPIRWQQWVYGGCKKPS